MNAEEITQLLRLIKYIEDLFDGTLGDWGTDPIGLELNKRYKPFNSKYYLFKFCLCVGTVNYFY